MSTLSPGHPVTLLQCDSVQPVTGLQSTLMGCLQREEDLAVPLKRLAAWTSNTPVLWST